MSLCPRFDAVSLGRKILLALPSGRPYMQLYPTKYSIQLNEKYRTGYINRSNWVIETTLSSVTLLKLQQQSVQFVTNLLF